MIEYLRLTTDNSDPLTLFRDGDMVSIEVGEGDDLQVITFQGSDSHDMDCLWRLSNTIDRFRNEAFKAAQETTP